MDSLVIYLFLGNNWQHRLVCAETISSWVRKVLSVSTAHIFWVLSNELQHLLLWQLVLPWCPFCRWVTGPEILHQLDTIFPPISLLLIGTRILCNMLYWASVSRCCNDKCQTFTYVGL